MLDRAGFAAESHSGRALRQILETYPRNELFQIDADELYEIATGILELQDRRQVRLFERRDDYGRFVSCLVYLPRDRYSTDRAEQIASRARGGLRRHGHRARGPDRDGRAGPAPRARRARRGGPPPADPRCREAPERHRRGLVGRARRRARRRAGRGCRPRRAGPLRQRVPGRLPGRLPAVDRRRRRRPPPGDRPGGRHHHRAAPSPGRRARGGALHADASGRAARAVRGAAAAGGPGRHGGRRADPRDPRRGAQRLALRHRAAGLGPRPDRRPRHPGRVLRHLRRALPGRARERRAEPARDRGRALGPPGRRAPRLREVPAPDRPVVQPALRRDDAGPPRADRRCARAAVRDPVRPVDRSRRRPRRQPGPRRRRPGPHRLDRGAARRRAQPGRGPHPPLVPHPDPGHAADERLPPARRRRPPLRHPAGALLQARPGGHPRPAAAPADVRDLGVLAPRRGRAPPGWAGGPRRAALERPPGGLPHRGARAHEGPDGQERGDHPRRCQGRLRREAARADHGRRGAADGGGRLLPGVRGRPPRRHRQRGRRRGRPPARRGPARPGRPLPRRGGRQGDGHVLRPRQLGRRELRVLAGRCVRVGRQRGLRPQGHGHHRPWRVGERPPPRPQPRSGRRHRPADGGRHRRHVGRRVRQRDAAQPAPAAGGRLRPPPHLPRPRPRPGPLVRRAAAPLRPPPLQLGRLRPDGHLDRRRRVAAVGQGHRPLGRGAAASSASPRRP